MANMSIPAGISAIGKTKMKNLHPSQPLKEKYGTAFDRDYLDGLVIQRTDKERVLRTGKVTNRFHFMHPYFPLQEFMVGKRLFSVIIASEHPFEVAPPPDAILTAPFETNLHQQAARASTINAVGLTPPAG